MTADAARPTIRVACGVIERGDGRVLLAQRPHGKIAAGCWEFPGGKIEPGEPPEAALRRELHEELGIDIEQARPLIRFRHDYTNRTVLLDTWLVTRFSGGPHGREGQAFAWVVPGALGAWPQTLPTVAPSARALRLASHYVFTPPDATAERILAGLPELPAGALLRLRLPSLAEGDYHELAHRLIPTIRASGRRFVLDRDPQAAAALGADGWHATSTAMDRMGRLAAGGPPLRLASCHDRAQLLRAAALGFDACVLGPVRPTASHPGAKVLGWTAFADAVQYAGLPVYAIGGIGPEALPQVFAAYGQGVAGISAFWS